MQDYENLVKLGVSVVYQLVMSPGQEMVGDACDSDREVAYAYVYSVTAPLLAIR